MKNTTYKEARTIAEYRLLAFGYDIVIPVGSRVSNRTACGYDDNYRFWQDWNKYAQDKTGHRNSILAHDLDHYGINIPASHCEPYHKEN